jgi:hypothetical protein
MKFRALVSSYLLVAACAGTVCAGPQQPTAPPQQPERPLPLTASELELYKHAQTLIDWSPRQVRDCPFLHKLRPAESQAQLPTVLDRVGQTSILLFHDFPQISCDEEVVSEVYSRRYHITPHHKFHYIVIPRPVDDLPAFEEYRTDLKGNPPDTLSLRDLFLLTSKFTSTWLYLSPADQPCNRFRHFGTQTIRNRECQVVGFAQEPQKARRVCRFLIGSNSAVLLLQGLAWIDSETFQVLRMETWLLAPRADISLGSQISTVDFYPVQPTGSERMFWLPRDVTVEMVYRGVPVRNTHHYSNFKLFRVESTIKPVG